MGGGGDDEAFTFGQTDVELRYSGVDTSRKLNRSGGRVKGVLKCKCGSTWA